ncbi:MAG: histidine phosphatase family protein [Cyclobacteriaceae bacterium]|nr:histidine phosphatase family protein [Cyclobacteriaceae bacterium]
MHKKQIFLLRHARTNDVIMGQNDRERELTSIGLQNATRMGIYFSNKGISFDQIISSPAIRAATTAKLVAEQIKYDTENIYFNEDIYEASVRTLLATLNYLKNEWEKVLLVGHNPAISYLAEYITGEPIGNITTCGLVNIKFNFKSWEEVGQGNGDFVEYLYPDQLNF